MKTKKYISKAPEETVEYGERLSKLIKKGDIICFFGDLGAGKTTMIKGIARGLNVKRARVNSPTFVLMNVYEGRLPIYHFDLYRLKGNENIASTGYDEFLYDEGVALVEWADHFGDLMPDEYLKVELKHRDLHRRQINLGAKGSRYQNIVDKMKVPA